MVIKISDQEFDNCRHSWDCRKIVQVAMAHGVLLSPQEAEKAWEEFSDSMAAGWMCIDGDDQYVYSPEKDDYERLSTDDYIWLSLPSWAKGE